MYANLIIKSISLYTHIFFSCSFVWKKNKSKNVLSRRQYCRISFQLYRRFVDSCAVLKKIEWRNSIASKRIIIKFIVESQLFCVYFLSVNCKWNCATSIKRIKNKQKERQIRESNFVFASRERYSKKELSLKIKIISNRREQEHAFWIDSFTQWLHVLYLNDIQYDCGRWKWSRWWCVYIRFFITNIHKSITVFISKYRLCAKQSIFSGITFRIEFRAKRLNDLIFAEQHSSPASALAKQKRELNAKPVNFHKLLPHKKCLYFLYSRGSEHVRGVCVCVGRPRAPQYVRWRQLVVISRLFWIFHFDGSRWFAAYSLWCSLSLSRCWLARQRLAGDACVCDFQTRKIKYFRTKIRLTYAEYTQKMLRCSRDLFI